MQVTRLFALAAVGGASLAMSQAYTFYGVTLGSNLITFDSATPGTINSSVGISGLQSGERLLGIDFRPGNGELFALGSTSRLYSINTSTGVATGVGGQFATLLNGNAFGFDFNPTVDRIRVTSNTGQNLRLNPNNGTVAFVDGGLAYAAGDQNNGLTPNVVASGYTNSFAGSTATTLYNIDSSLDTLVTQTPPNDGTLNTVGALGVNPSNVTDMDIVFAGGQNFAFFSTNVPNNASSSFYSINLATGAGSLIGNFGGSQRISLIAAQPVPEPTTMLILAIGGAAMLRRRKKA